MSNATANVQNAIHSLGIGVLEDDAPTGKPLDILLTDIQENPDNPRAEFEPEPLQELADDIKANGVISPVSVFLSPEGSPAMYTLNYGARRFRASELAGMTTIPAFVADELDAYQRVAENEQRSNLKPLEFALFIKSRMAAGESQSYIAKRMNKTDSYISEQLALLDLQPEILEAWKAGVITAQRAAVDLSNHVQRLTDTGKGKVVQALKSGDKVSRATVADIKNATASNIKKSSKKESDFVRRKLPQIDGKSFKIIGVKDDVMTVKLKGDKAPTQYRLVPVDQPE